MCYGALQLLAVVCCLIPYVVAPLPSYCLGGAQFEAFHLCQVQHDVPVPLQYVQVLSLSSSG